MKFIKELSDFYRFFFNTTNECKNIAFFGQHEGYYSYFEGLIKELTENHQQTISYITSDINDPVLRNSDERIKTFYINNLMVIFLLFIKCRVFVMTLTDLNQLHYKRSIYPVHYVYVFHSMVSTHMMYLFGAFDHYDSILCVGPYQVDEIRSHEKSHNLPKKKLVEAGYYRLERINKKYNELTSEKITARQKTTVLIAPSWGAKNILESCGESLVKLLLDAGFSVVVRPHPETIKRTPKIIESLDRKFRNNPEFILERSVATDDSLLRSDVLICDCSGVALEYAFGTERPVLFLDVPYKIRNKRYTELGIEPFELSLRDKIGTFLSLDELDSVPQLINKMIKEREERKDRIIELRKANIFAFGNSSKTGAKHIIDLI